MVEEDQYCIDILTQVCRGHPKALQAVSLALLDDHLGHVRGPRRPRPRAAPRPTQKLREASEAIARLVRSPDADEHDR
jgi:DNA-binding FrmR family transcriptional regulator